MSRMREGASYYEAQRDDPDLWGEPEDPGELPRRTGLTATIAVRFSAEEAEAIRRVAREAELTYSEVVRQAVQMFVQPVSGA